MWAVSSSRADICARSAHQSCVNIDRRKQEMRGQDGRRKRGGGKGESGPSDIVTEKERVEGKRARGQKWKDA